MLLTKYVTLRYLYCRKEHIATFKKLPHNDFLIDNGYVEREIVDYKEHNLIFSPIYSNRYQLTQSGVNYLHEIEIPTATASRSMVAIVISGLALVISAIALFK